MGDAVRIIPSQEVPDRIGGWIVGAPYLLLWKRRVRSREAPIR